MDDKSPKCDWPEVNDESRRIWDANAEWWDDKIGDGNAFQCELIEPATERLLEIGPGTTVLDVGGGAGRFARRMAELGAYVVATDFSERFIERAKSRTPAEMRNIEYHVVDATSGEQLLALGAARFDGAVATMALMDMATIAPLMSALPKLLKPGGWFVFSINHPCFNSAHPCKFAEMVEADGETSIRCGVKVSSYLTPGVSKCDGIMGQPQKQYYFHRPLSVLFNAAFSQGFVIDGLEEPMLPPIDDARYLRWRSMPEIPPVLVVRMRCRSG